MSRSNTLIVLGLIIGLVPFSGLPSLWLEFILPVAGLIVLFIGYAIRERRPRSETPVTV